MSKNHLCWAVVSRKTNDRLSTYRGTEKHWPESWQFRYYTETEGIVDLVPLPPGKHSVERQVPRFFNSRNWQDYIKAAARAFEKQAVRVNDFPVDVVVLAAYVWYHRTNRSKTFMCDSEYRFWEVDYRDLPAVLPISPAVIVRMKESTRNKYSNLVLPPMLPYRSTVVDLIQQATAPSSAESAAPL